MALRMHIQNWHICKKRASKVNLFPTSVSKDNVVESSSKYELGYHNIWKTLLLSKGLNMFYSLILHYMWN